MRHSYDFDCQVALTFLNDQCFSTHGKISISAIFLSPSGEWKLGGFELFSSPKDESPLLYVSVCFYEYPCIKFIAVTGYGFAITKLFSVCSP